MVLYPLEVKLQKVVSCHGSWESNHLGRAAACALDCRVIFPALFSGFWLVSYLGGLFCVVFFMSSGTLSFFWSVNAKIRKSGARQVMSG